MLDLSGNALVPPSEIERQRRYEAVREHRADPRAQAATARSELANLRCELQVAADLTRRLAAMNDVAEMVDAVVVELSEKFAFYLVAILRLDDDVLHLMAARGELAGVMNEFLLVEQSVADGVNGRAVRTARTQLVPETRVDPDYVVRDAATDPRSELSVPIISDGRTWGVLNLEAVEPDGFDEAQAVLAETIAGSLGSAIHRARLVDELHHSFTTTLAALTGAVETKDDGTAVHGHDVAEIAERIARRLGLSESEARDVRHAALLHDVGKIAVPSEILLKPASLTEEEWEVMRSHADIGADLVARIDAFAHMADAVRHHHERMDGTGYPSGLSGEEIPLAARIIAACDTFDAITSDRPYRRGSSVEEACAELERVAGSQLDPKVVEALLSELS